MVRCDGEDRGAGRAAFQNILGGHRGGAAIRSESLSLPSPKELTHTHTYPLLLLSGPLELSEKEMVLPSSSLGPRTRGLVSPSCCESRRLCLWNLDTALLRSQLPGDAQGRRPRPHCHQQQQQRPHPSPPATPPAQPPCGIRVLPELGPPRGGPHRLPSFFLLLSLSLSLPECLPSHCLRDSEHP